MVIIEDDAYRELYYDAESGPLPPTLYALNEGWAGDTHRRILEDTRAGDQAGVGRGAT